MQRFTRPQLLRAAFRCQRWTSYSTDALSLHAAGARCDSPKEAAPQINTDRPDSYVFWSTSTDPYYNLAFENYLLTKAHPTSNILLLYQNDPCVVLGRNQNPWLELNLSAIKVGLARPLGKGKPSPVQIARRRSGGGTVFHDEGNLNYAVITPNDKSWERKKHAEMVARAAEEYVYYRKALLEDKDIHQLKAAKQGTKVWVNKRNDIVMQKLKYNAVNLKAVHETPPEPDPGPVLKISGTAFRLTGKRALHHGTLLYASPYLDSIRGFLRSPAKQFIGAKGVESVRSPVGNLFKHVSKVKREAYRHDLMVSVRRAFEKMYPQPEDRMHFAKLPENIDKKLEMAIGEQQKEILTPEWRWAQTPAFVFSTVPVEGENDLKPNADMLLETSFPEDAKVTFWVRNGAIEKTNISLSTDEAERDRQKTSASDALVGKKLWEIKDWRPLLKELDGWTSPQTAELTGWLNTMLPSVD